MECIVGTQEPDRSAHNKNGTHNGSCPSFHTCFGKSWLTATELCFLRSLDFTRGEVRSVQRHRRLGKLFRREQLQDPTFSSFWDRKCLREGRDWELGQAGDAAPLLFQQAICSPVCGSFPCKEPDIRAPFVAKRFL